MSERPTESPATDLADINLMAQDDVWTLISNAEPARDFRRRRSPFLSGCKPRPPGDRDPLRGTPRSHQETRNHQANPIQRVGIYNPILVIPHEIQIRLA